VKFDVPRFRPRPSPEDGEGSPDEDERFEAFRGIAEVVPGSAADLAGLKRGDVILAVGSTPTASTNAVIEAIQKHEPGASVKLTIRRNQEELVKTARLGFYDATFPQEDLNIELSGDISTRRTGFKKIIQHDTPLPPKAMGGPVLTLEGEAIGINIARYDRVATFALPANLVLSLIEKLK